MGGTTLLPAGSILNLSVALVSVVDLFIFLVQKDKNWKIKSKDNITQHFKNNQRREIKKKKEKKDVYQCQNEAKR